MEIWVQNVKTEKTWLLDSDVTKEVYSIKGQTYYKGGIKCMYNYKFYPCDPRRCKKIEADTEGYQYTIEDYLKGIIEK